MREDSRNKQEKDKSGEAASEDTKHTLTLDFWAPGPRENKLGLLKPPGVQYFVTAA